MSPPTADRGEGSLRGRVARGVLVNGAFLAAVNGLSLVRGALVVIFLSAAEYGVWGIVSGALALLLALRRNGIADRYVQQDDGDQRHAFQVALTLELLFSAALVCASVVLFPIVALVYGRPELLMPGLVLALLLPGLALQAPLAVFYRRLDFKRQRLLQAVDPVVAFAITVPLVAGGSGYWGVVGGAVAGAWAAALVALLACPYPLRLRWDPAAARRYARFAWPMLIAAAVGVLMAQALMLAAEAHIGLAGAGIIALSLTISQYANRVDQIVGGTLYPALCAVRTRTDLLVESFSKSNHASMMWGAPLGLGLAIFAEPIVQHGLGDRWDGAVPVLQATGIIVAVHRFAYNWDSFFRAVGRTREIAINAIAVAIGFVVLPAPLIVLGGMERAALALLALEAISLVVRLVLVRRLFAIRDGLVDCLRAAVPAAAAAGLVLLSRLLFPGADTADRAVLEAVAFVILVAAAVARLERGFLSEAVEYLRRGARQDPLTVPI